MHDLRIVRHGDGVLTMDGFFTVLMLYMLFLFFLEEAGPTLVQAFGALLRFLAKVLITGTMLIGMAGFEALKWLGRKSVPATQFLYFLIAEMLKGSAEDSSEHEDPDELETPGVDALEAACALLGLARSFSRDEFKQAYRRAIRATHPDHGGSDEAAQAVNAARELIERHYGWGN